MLLRVAHGPVSDRDLEKWELMKKKVTFIIDTCYIFLKEAREFSAPGISTILTLAFLFYFNSYFRACLHGGVTDLRKVRLPA